MKTSLISTIMLLAVSGCAAIEPDSGRQVTSSSHYVSMGSSFAAGAGIGPLQENAPKRCNRTTNNYASIVAKQLILKLSDVSCGGATTDHILGSWNELPPQIEAAKRDTQLVTVTIGGNDLGNVGFLFAGSCRFRVGPSSTPCKVAPEPTEADYEKLEQKLRAIAEQVRLRAPRARLVFIQYVTLLSATSCALEAISPQDATIAKRISARLSRTTENAARTTGAEVLNADVRSRAHTPCTKVAWSNGLSQNYNRTDGAAWHPNAAGHAGIADLLVRLLNSGKDNPVFSAK